MCCSDNKHSTAIFYCQQKNCTEIFIVNIFIKLRKQLGLKQRELASELGISQGYMSELEKGVKIPSNTLLIAMQHKFNLSSDWVFAGEGNMFVDNIPTFPEGMKFESEPAYGHVPEHLYEKWKTKKYNKEELLLAITRDDLLLRWYSSLSPDEKTWFRIEIKNKYPQFAEWLKNNT